MTLEKLYHSNIRFSGTSSFYDYLILKLIQIHASYFSKNKIQIDNKILLN